MTFTADCDVTGVVSRLYVYPVKSCAGIGVTEALLTPTGLDLDRAWMVVDEQGDFLTQRSHPRMALIRPQLKASELVLRAPGMLALYLSIDAVEGPTTVSVWGDSVPAWDMGDLAAQWFTDFLGQRCRLARFDPDHRRLSSLQWTGGVEAPTQFADGYAVLVTSEASLDELNARLASAGHCPAQMEQFRPNVVFSGIAAHDEDRMDRVVIGGSGESAAHLQLVKPCTRCSIPDIDPATAQSHPGVSETLQTYRQDHRVNGAITFGMNAIVREGDGLWLRVGQAVGGTLRFD